MPENRVIPLRQPDEIDDPLTEILRSGAKRLVQQAVEAEFAGFLARHAGLELPDGRQRVVRHGHDPVRPIQTGIGPVEVSKPKARDRGAATADARIRYASAILPKWARRTKSLDVLLPALYLRGVSTGDFQDVLTALLGKDAPNLSPSVIGRLKSEWEDEYRRWQTRDLSARRYIYVWADGVYLQARMEPQAECMLVLIGATPEGRKELLGLQTGMRKSGQSWKELLVDLKARGLSIAPDIGVGDGALGFWKALEQAFPSTRRQRCWQHKTLNVLDKLPKSVQPNAHRDLREACNGTAAQSWAWNSDDGTLRTLNKRLDVTGGASASGTPLQLWDCNGTGAQEWRWRQQTRLLNPQSGRCMSVAGGSVAGGARLQISDCEDTTGQVWGLP